MIFAALSEAAERDELLLVDGGLCRFHRRRDGVVVIREILVLPGLRRRGVGRHLIDAVARRHPHAELRAKCPAGSEANHFWRGIGFELFGEEGGLNRWDRY